MSRPRGCRPIPFRPFFLFAVLSLALLHARALASDGIPDFRILEESAAGVVFEYRLPAVAAVPAPGGGVSLRMEGGRLIGETGFPALPVRPFVIALPPGAEMSVDFGDLRTEETDGWDVAPQPALTDSGEAPAPWAPDLPEGLVPSRWYEVSPPSRLRDHRVVAVTLHPLRYDAGTGTTAILRSAIVRIRFAGGRTGNGGGGALRDPFEGVYRATILNHRSASAWREGPSKSLRKRVDSFASSEAWIRIEIGERGLYSIAYDDLEEAGVLDPLSEIGDARTIRLFTGNGLPLPVELSEPRDEWMGECAIRVVGEEDGAFDPWDRVEFYGMPPRGWTGEFDPDAESYYERFDHPHADRNVYWLTWGGEFSGAPKRMGTTLAGPDAVPGGAPTHGTFSEVLHFEEDLFLDLTRYGSDGWFWTDRSGQEPFWTGDVAIPDPDTASAGTLRARFYHYETALNSCGTQGMIVRVNGDVLGSDSWDSCERECDSVYVDEFGREICVDPHIAPHDVFVEGVRLREAGVGIEFEATMRKHAYLDWFDVGYDRLFRAREGELRFRLPGEEDARVPIEGLPAGSRTFDVVDPKEVKELADLGVSGDSLVLFVPAGSPRTFHALGDSAWRKPAAMERRFVEDLRAPARGGEYLILAADECVSAALPLAALRSGEGTVKTVKLSDVYDQFAWGLPDPAAIRDFLAWALREWPEGERPAYVLLLGDATDDFRNRLETPDRNVLPTHYRVDPSGAEIGTYATDDYFAYLDPDSGEGDWAPDLAIGRLPAQDAGEGAAMIDKIVSYESSPERGSWRNRLLFLADDEYKRGGTNGYDCTFLLSHTADAEFLAAARGDRYEREKVYLVEYPLSPNALKPEAKEAYLRRFSEGHVLASYTGHGGFDKMADEEVLIWRDVSSETLGNGSRLPFLSAWACDLGRFDLRHQDCLSEKMMKLEEGGIVGFVAGTEGTFGSVSRELARDFLEGFVPDTGAGFSMGNALLAAKVLTGVSRNGRKINDEKYVLCGDPAMKIGIPEDGIRVLGGDTLALRRGEAAMVRGEVVDPFGARISSFEGILELTARGAADTSGYSFMDSVCGGGSTPRERHVDHDLLGPLFHRGEADVTGGAFEATFFVPLDIPAGPFGRVGFYAYAADGREAAGGSDSVAVRPEPDDYERDDFDGPSIRLVADGAEHTPGFRSTSRTSFEVVVEDGSGIAYDGTSASYVVGLSFDDGPAVDLTPRFALDRNAYRSGRASFRLPEVSADSLADGEHELTFFAKDGFGNESEAAYRVDYTVDPRPLAFLGEVLNYPNPFDPDREETEIAVDLSRDARLEIRILTLTGKRIRVLGECRAYGAARMTACTWDGRDGDGDRVANGVYLIRVIAETADGRERAESIGKAVVRRGR